MSLLFFEEETPLLKFWWRYEFREQVSSGLD